MEIGRGPAPSWEGKRGVAEIGSVWLPLALPAPLQEMRPFSSCSQAQGALGSIWLLFSGPPWIPGLPFLSAVPLGTSGHSEGELILRSQPFGGYAVRQLFLQTAVVLLLGKEPVKEKTPSPE